MTSQIRWFSTTPMQPATAERAGGTGIRAPIGSSTARRRPQPRCATPGAAGFARGSPHRSSARAPGNGSKSMDRVVKASLILAAALGGLAGQARSARADFVRQVVTYTVSNMIVNPPNANGLVLSFARDQIKIGDAKGVVSVGGNNANSSLTKPINYRQPVGAKGAVGASDVTSGINNAPMATAKWTAGTINIKPGDSASIDFQRPNSTGNPRIVGGTWESNGAAVAGSTVTLPAANPSKITVNDFNLASVTFTNDSDVAATFSNIQYVINNSMSNYNIDSFFTPTGTSILTGLPNNSLTVAPESQMTVEIGTVDPTKYELVFADVSLSGSSTSSPVILASAVPEPSSLTLAILSTLGLTARGLYRSRGRQRDAGREGA